MPIDTGLLQPRVNFATPQVDVAGPMTAIGQGIGNIIQQRRNQQALNAVLPKLMGSDQQAAQSAIMGLFGVDPQLGTQAATAYKALHPELTPYQQFEEWATYNRLSDPYRDMSPSDKSFCRQNPTSDYCRSAMAQTISPPPMGGGAPPMGGGGVSAPMGGVAGGVAPQVGDTAAQEAPPKAPEDSPPPPSDGSPKPYDNPQEMEVGKKLDSEYATKDYLPWSQGGYAEAQHGLRAIKRAIDILKKNPNASGPWIGTGVLADPNSMSHKLVSMYQPEALTAAAEHQRGVAASIKALAGSRPSVQLYNAILKSTYDPTAQPEDNIARLQLLYDNLSEQEKAKQRMARYFFKNKTLNGYTGPRFQEDMDFQFPEIKPSGPGIGDVMSLIPNIPSPISSVGLGQAGMAMGEAANQQPQAQAVGPMTGRSFVQPQAFTPSGPALNAPPVPGSTQPIQRDPRGAYLQGQRTTATGPNGHKIVLSPDGTYWIDTVTGKRLPQ